MFKKKPDTSLTEQQQDLMKILVGTVTHAEVIFDVLDKTTDDEVKKLNLRTSYLTLVAHTLGVKTRVTEVILDDLIRGLNK